ncbi:MAG: hypothetical protein WCH99_15875 [Verrucomicrobiota bacterium]
MRFGPDYYAAKQMQTVLSKAVCDGTTSPRDAALCTRSWIELERLKREMRGIPPLAAAKVGELLANLKRAKPAEIDEPVEV